MIHPQFRSSEEPTPNEIVELAKENEKRMRAFVGEGGLALCDRLADIHAKEWLLTSEAERVVVKECVKAVAQMVFIECWRARMRQRGVIPGPKKKRKGHGNRPS